MFNIFKKKKGTGALVDNRPAEAKAKDYLLEEIVASADPVVWVEKSDWRKFPIYNQNGSGSCVAQTVAKMIGIHYWLLNNEYVHFSATHLYQRRSNKPAGGMIGVNAGDIARQGVTLEDLVPSQEMTDEQMDSIVIPEYKTKVGEIFKVDNYVQLATRDIDAIASTIQKTGKPVMVWYYFNHDEWTSTPTVKRNVDLYAANTSRHSVTAVDFMIKNGKKVLVIEDSWGTSYGERGQRFITEDFHRQRNFFSMYFTNFKFEVQENNKGLSLGWIQLPLSTDEIKAIQDALRLQGFFPVNTTSTGFYGAITKKAVSDFQSKYGLLTDGIIGSKTLEKLKSLYP